MITFLLHFNDAFFYFNAKTKNCNEGRQHAQKKKPDEENWKEENGKKLQCNGATAWWIKIDERECKIVLVIAMLEEKTTIDSPGRSFTRRSLELYSLLRSKLLAIDKNCVYYSCRYRDEWFRWDFSLRSMQNIFTFCSFLFSIPEFPFYLKLKKILCSNCVFVVRLNGTTSIFIIHSNRTWKKYISSVFRRLMLFRASTSLIPKWNKSSTTKKKELKKTSNTHSTLIQSSFIVDFFRFTFCRFSRIFFASHFVFLFLRLKLFLSISFILSS